MCQDVYFPQHKLTALPNWTILCPKSWCFTFGPSIFVITVGKSGVNLSFKKLQKININFCWSFCILINLRTLYVKRKASPISIKFIFLFANEYLVLFTAIQTQHTVVWNWDWMIQTYLHSRGTASARHSTYSLVSLPASSPLTLLSLPPSRHHQFELSKCNWFASLNYMVENPFLLPLFSSVLSLSLCSFFNVFHCLHVPTCCLSVCSEEFQFGNGF